MISFCGLWMAFKKKGAASLMGDKAPSLEEAREVIDPTRIQKNVRGEVFFAIDQGVCDGDAMPSALEEMGFERNVMAGQGLESAKRYSSPGPSDHCWCRRRKRPERSHRSDSPTTIPSLISDRHG
jgi:hypothetical protein